MKKLSAALLLALSIIGACSKSEKTEGTVLARVNDETLTMEDIIYQIPPEFRSQLSREGFTDIVENWINTEVLYQTAVGKGLDKDQEVQAVIKAMIREAVARKLIDAELKNQVNVAPSAVDSIYDARRESYKLEKDRFRASHILLPSAGEAEAVYKRLVGGEDFSRLAVDYSVDRRSADRGGDIGYFAPEDIDPKFAEAIKKLNVGSYSKPVETSYGYHIIMLTGKQKAGVDLDSLEAKRNILDSLYTSGHTGAFQKLLDSLKLSAKIERFPLTDSILTKGTGIGLP
jgi:parvulin-like peptidyl-prolyl isomerase